MYNSVCFSSVIRVGDVTLGALISREPLRKGDRIARYTGRAIYDTSWNSMTTSHEYLLKATQPSDMRRNVTIDGNPALYNNLGGYANFVIHKYANAEFSDDADEAPDGAEHWVWIVAKESIPRGREIRVDYDQGSKGHPFQEQMLKEGAPRDALNKPAYKKFRMDVPSDFSKATLAEDPVSDESDDDEPILARAARKGYVTLPKRPRGRLRAGMRWDPVRGLVPL